MYTPTEFVHRYPPQAVRYGVGGARRLAPLLEELAIERALLACGPSTFANGSLVTDVCDGAGGRIAAVWSGVEPHTPVDTVDDALDRYRDEDCDALISIGGGSAHDTIRGVAYCLANATTMVAAFGSGERTSIRFDGPATLPPARMLAIPSTLSAAETTFGGGIKRGRQKILVHGDALYIGTLLLDPAVFASTPRDVFLASGMNALNHAVERLCSPAHEPLADAGFLHALRLLLPSLTRIHTHGMDDLDALGLCALGANLSDSTQVFGGLAHAIAHTLGGRYHISHGIANGVVLPLGVSAAGPYAQAPLEMIHDILREVGLTEPGDGLAAEVQAVLARYVASLGLPSRLRDIGVEHDEIGEIVADTTRDWSFSQAHGGLSRERVAELLEQIW